MYWYWWLLALVYESSLCAKPTCLECTFRKTDSDSEIYFCYKCYLTQIAVQTNDIENNMTYDELPEILREKGLETTTSDTIVDLLDILDAHETREMYNKLATSKVKIPIEGPDYLQTLVDNNQITSFDFCCGGQFVVDSKLSAIEVFKMLKILAALVTIKNNNNQQEYINRAYRLVPKMIVDFAS
jgi:hypothetical protein